MKLIKINTDHYVIVDDSEIKEGDWVVGGTRTVVQCMYPENVHHRDVKKITHSTQPIEEGTTIHGIEHKRWNHVKFIDLSEVKELIGEVDVEKKAELYVWGGVYLTEQEKQQTEIAYMTGYNQALEDNKDKKYTEEDILDAWELGAAVGLPLTKDKKEKLFQSLQPKTEWEVEFDKQGKLKQKS